jgi:hypothetical protein
MLLHEHSAETANIAVAQLLAIIEAEENVRVRLGLSIAVDHFQIASHSQMNNQVNVSIVSGLQTLSPRQLEHQELTVAANILDSLAGCALGNRYGIIDKVSLAEAHVEDFSAGQDVSQTSYDSFNFG